MRRVALALLAAIPGSAAAWAAHADSGWVFSSSLDLCSSAPGCPYNTLYPDAQAVPKAEYVSGGISVDSPSQFLNVGGVLPGLTHVSTYSYATFTATKDESIDFHWTYASSDVLSPIGDPAGITVSNGFALNFLQGAPSYCTHVSIGLCWGASGDSQFNVHPGDTITIYAGTLGDYYEYGDSEVTITGPLFDQSVTAVPEPAAWALMILGFAGLGAALRGGRRLRTA